MSGFMNVLMAAGRRALGVLSGTIVTSGSSGNLIGFSVAAGIGSLSATGLSGGYNVVEMDDNTATNKFNFAVSDAGGVLLQDAFTQIDVNGRVFTAAAATFFPGPATALWQWGNAGVAVTAAGRPFAIT